jgi:hypothetical protein
MSTLSTGFNITEIFRESPGYLNIQDEGVSISTNAKILNFIGAFITSSLAGDVINITVDGTGINTTDFKYILSATDDTVQKALNTLDRTLFNLNKVYNISDDYVIPSKAMGIYVVDTSIKDISITLPTITDIYDSNYPYIIVKKSGSNKITVTSLQKINDAVSDVYLYDIYDCISLMSLYDTEGKFYIYNDKRNVNVYDSQNIQSINLVKGTTSYNLSKIPLLPSKIKIFYNGYRLNNYGSSYTILNNVIALSEVELGFIIENTDKLLVEYV